MDSLDLLAREEEFRKLNKQLNKKTESLMREIEQAMQKPDIFTDFSHSLILNPNKKNIKKYTCHSPSDSSSSVNTLKDKKALTNKTQLHQKCKRIHFVSQINDNGYKKANLDAKNPIKNFIDDNITTSDAIKNTNSVTCLQKDAAATTNGIKSDQTQSSHEENANNIDNESENIDKYIDNDDVKSVGDDKNLKNDDFRSRNGVLNTEYVCTYCNEDVKRDDSLEFLYAFVSLNINDDILPKSFLRGDITVERVCKCLSSKIKLLQEQIERLQSDIKMKKTQCESHLTQLAEMESERMTLINKTNNMTSNVVEMKTKCMALQKRLEEKDRLYKEQRSEADKLSSEIKRLKSKNATVEAKCATQEEVIDTLKQQLEVARRVEKEFKDSSRVLSASHESAISRLESQIKTITKRIEKQMALINNLRKQNAILTTEGALKALEKEYSGFLNQDLE